jgi:serine/threonine-protein kinase HipA
MTTRTLAVLVDDRQIGQLSEANDLWHFDYAPEWLAAADGYDLSPALSRKEPHHADGASHRPVQWYFDNLLPEEALRSVLAAEANISAEDAFGLLAYYGAESAGALTLLAAGNPAPATAGLRPLPAAALSQRIRDLPRISLASAAPKHMSLAGAQHKLLVVEQDGELFEPLAATPSTHILKPDHPDPAYPATVVNETFCMRLAAGLGLAPPRVEMRYVPEPVYLVERFDRVTRTDAPPRRRHAIDTCQLLDKARTFKYTAARLDSIVLAAALCRSKAAARIHLFRWLVFNLLTGNGDNHLKNISFLVDAEGIELAPPYDLLCTAVYETPACAGSDARWPRTALAFALDDATHFTDVSRDHVLRAGRALGLAEATARRELDGMLHALPAEADRLLGEMERTLPALARNSPDPAAAADHVAGELRLLRAIRWVVIAEMIKRLTLIPS